MNNQDLQNTIRDNSEAALRTVQSIVGLNAADLILITQYTLAANAAAMELRERLIHDNKRTITNTK